MDRSPSEVLRDFGQALDPTLRAAARDALPGVLRALTWRDAGGAVVAGPLPASLRATTWGEVAGGWQELRLEGTVIRYPGADAPRGLGLHLDGDGVQASIDSLPAALAATEDGGALVEALSLSGARARWPDAEFRWRHGAVERAWRVVGEVEAWPGEIQLQAARCHEPTLRIGDALWLEEPECLPAWLVLDWLADGG